MFANPGTTLTTTKTSTVGSDCTYDKDVCTLKTECCGTAKKDASYTASTNYAKDGVTRTVCNTSADKTWVQTLTNAKPNSALYTFTSETTGKAAYTFSCNTGASSLAQATAILFAALISTQ